MPKLPRLRRLREEATLTQEQLAQKSGVSKPTINRAEAGGEVRIGNVAKLARALKVKARELMGTE